MSSMDTRDFVAENTIFLTISGSNLYGTNTPASDIDKRGVCIPPPKIALGFANRFEQQESSIEDTVIYSLNKFCSLAAQQNPNILELLFVPKTMSLIWTPTWQILYDNRHEFLSSAVFKTYQGYAISQIKKMETHRNWLKSPPIKQPERSDFGLAETSHGVKELFTGIDAAEIDKSALAIIEKEKQYKSALTKYNQYNEWRKNRNPVRAALEAKYGMDCKFAMHLVRLLRTCYEILTTGELIVRRPDAKELLDIRNGAWTYEQLMEFYNDIIAKIADIYNNKTYVVKHKVDAQKLSDICAELHISFWNEIAADELDEKQGAKRSFESLLRWFKTEETGAE